MSDASNEQREDNVADAIAVTAIIALFVGTIVYWLSGMPT